MALEWSYEHGVHTLFDVNEEKGTCRVLAIVRKPLIKEVDPDTDLFILKTFGVPLSQEFFQWEAWICSSDSVGLEHYPVMGEDIRDAKVLAGVIVNTNLKEMYHG